MINILSYIGMNLQSEVCLWTLLGLLLTIFDATLFKVNANLKQVWQMVMPPELSLHVQRVLRTMISGVMLVQCFTVYVYLASYIVLLYPVFLEERPTLVLPWLLLAAIRNFLCELTSLALGLGTCVLLGPARPPCIKFLIIKLASIMPSFYMWMLIFSYYHNLKLASTFKTFPAVSPVNNLDYGLELAIRRRRTKSLLGEDQLRKKLIASLYHENLVTVKEVVSPNLQTVDESDKKSVNSNNEEAKSSSDIAYPFAVTANRTTSDIGTFEDWVGSEVVLPRVADRILEQFVLMLLRIGAFLNKDEADVRNILSANSQAFLPPKCNRQECPGIPTEETETPPFVGNSKGRIQSYLLDYPQIFLRKPSDILGSHNINEHKFRETNLFDNKESPLELSRAHTSDSVKTISLDNVSLSRRDKEFFEDRKDLIHSDQDLYKSAPSSSRKHIEFLNGSTTICERTESSVNVSSSDDINRMKYPADLSLDRQKNERSLLTEHSSKKEISLPKSNVERKSNTNIKIESDDQLLSQDKNQKDK